MRVILLLLTSLAVAPLHAQNTPPSAGAGMASPLGKLFLSPERRLQLERQRQLNIRETQNLEADTLQLNGVVQRSSGRNSVWVNHQMKAEDRQSSSATVKVHRQRPAEASVGMDQDQPVRLQVGESLNRSTGERNDIVTPGGVRVVKPAP